MKTKEQKIDEIVTVMKTLIATAVDFEHSAMLKNRIKYLHDLSEKQVDEMLDIATKKHISHFDKIELIFQAFADFGLPGAYSKKD